MLQKANIYAVLTPLSIVEVSSNLTNDFEACFVPFDSYCWVKKLLLGYMTIEMVFYCTY